MEYSFISIIIMKISSHHSMYHVFYGFRKKNTVLFCLKINTQRFNLVVSVLLFDLQFLF